MRARWRALRWRGFIRSLMLRVSQASSEGEKWAAVSRSRTPRGRAVERGRVMVTEDAGKIGRVGGLGVVIGALSHMRGRGFKTLRLTRPIDTR